MNRSIAAPLALAALILGFAVGVGALYKLRFESGEEYPHYSSFRADPLGAKALYESFQSVPGMTVRRNFLPLGQTKLTPDESVLLLGGWPDPTETLTEAESRVLTDFLAHGGRLAVAFSPPMEIQFGFPEAREFEGENENDPAPSEESEKFRRLWEKRQEAGDSEPKRAENPDDTTAGQPESGDAETPADGESVAEPNDADPDSIADADPDSDPPASPETDEPEPDESPSLRDWLPDDRPTYVTDFFGFLFGRDPLEANETVAARTATAPKTLPASLLWHKRSVWFTEMDPAWNPLYTVKGKTVVAERRFGRGSIIVFAESYLFSNQALREHRQSALLATLAGDKRTLVFDESHLGVVEQMGVSSLIWRYRLYGFAGGLLAVFGLFVWRNTTPFIPALPDDDLDESGAVLRGYDSATGLTNLLRRSVPASDLPAVCVDEWERTFAQSESGKTRHRERIAAARRILASATAAGKKASDPMAVYRQIEAVMTARR